MATVAEELQGLMTVALQGVPRDLSLTALSTLAGLERTGPRRLTDLAAAQNVTQPSMTTLVTNLERAGYVQRRREQADGRVALVAITDAGSKLLAERRRAGADAMARLIDQLEPGEVAALTNAQAAISRLRELGEGRRDGIA